MTCDAVRQCLLDSLDGPIQTDRQSAAELHAVTCTECREFIAIQKMLDEHLIAATYNAFPIPGFRRELLQKCHVQTAPDWSESLPDVAHLTGCALALVLLLVFMPQYSKIVLVAVPGFTLVTYFLQAMLRSSIQSIEQ